MRISLSRCVLAVVEAVGVCLAGVAADVPKNDKPAPAKAETKQQPSAKEMSAPVKPPQPKAEPAKAEPPQPLVVWVPDDFPRFIILGVEEPMIQLRRWFYQHYILARPMATLWDQWLPFASLWPGVDSSVRDGFQRNRWRNALLNRSLSEEGYVSTHQHAGLAHNDGWPFPLWAQAGGQGWHFSLVGNPFGGSFKKQLSTPAGWELVGLADKGVDPKTGWTLEQKEVPALLTTPPFRVDCTVAPFLRLAWQGQTPGFGQPFVEWTTESERGFSPERRMYFSPLQAPARMTFTHIPLYRHPQWKGVITQLRFHFDNPAPVQSSSKFTPRALITAIDSRHNVNNANYLGGKLGRG